MNTLSKLALLAAATVFAASASAQSVYTPSTEQAAERTVPASQQAINSNWVNGTGDQAWMSNGGTRCVRSADWTSTTANKGCDGAIVEKPYVPVAPPVDTAPIAPPIASEKVTYQLEARFAFDKAELSVAERAKLDEFYAKVKGIDNLEVVVVTGYTDEMGSVDYNMALSQRRAENVKKHLVAKGIEPARIYTEGKGKSNPVVTDCQEQVSAQHHAKGKHQARSQMIRCSAPNRRVEIQAVGTVRNAQPETQSEVGVM